MQAGQELCRIDSDVLTSLKLQMDAASVSSNEAARELARQEPLYACLLYTSWRPRCWIRSWNL